MNTVQRYRKADWSKVWHFRQFHGNFANITYFENMESLNSRWFCLGKRFQTFFGGMDVVALRWYSPAWRWKVHLDAMQFFVGVLWQNAPSVAGGTPKSPEGSGRSPAHTRWPAAGAGDVRTSRDLSSGAWCQCRTSLPCSSALHSLSAFLLPPPSPTMFITSSY